MQSNVTHQSPHRGYYFAHLDNIGHHASPLQQQRFDMAVSYLESHYRSGNSVDRDTVLKHLNTIDFSQEVKVREITPNDRLYQYSQPITPGNASAQQRDCVRPEAGATQTQPQYAQGEYFCQSGVSAEGVGVSLGDPLQPRARVEYYVEKPIYALETHHKTGIVDMWTNGRLTRDPSVSTVGGVAVENRDSIGRMQTKNAAEARSIYSRSTSNSNSSSPTPAIEHRSGPYVAGGDKQILIPKRPAPNEKKSLHDFIKRAEQRPEQRVASRHSVREPPQQQRNICKPARRHEQKVHTRKHKR